MSDIDNLFEMLSWRSEKCIQTEGIERAKKVKHLSIFIQPIEDKSVWDNCAKILTSKTDIELEPYLISLLEWLQDENWPGYDEIFMRLSTIPAQALCWPISYCIDKANKLNDKEWLHSLAQISIKTNVYGQLLPGLRTILKL